MSFKSRMSLFETYDRMRAGQRLPEKEWDQKITIQTTTKLKEKYKLNFDRHKIVPDDEDQIDRLWQAGREMFLTMGYFNSDMERVCKVTEDELDCMLDYAPRTLTLGEGRDKRELKARRFDDPRPPHNQGGPTGCPMSEDVFVGVHEAYAREPLVDSIVDGVVNTIYGKDPKPSSPNEIAAVQVEAVGVREGMRRAGRPGMAY